MLAALAARLTAWPALLSSSLGLGRAASDRAEEPDDWLVSRARRGDRRAFEDLYRRHAPLVWRVLTRVCGPDPEREDLVQQVFLEVFRALENFRGDAAFGTYLYRVATNVALDHLERRWRRPRALPAEKLLDLDDPSPSPERQAQGREHLRVVYTLLDRIKPKKRLAFLLRVVEGLSLEEVGAVVGARPDTVAQRVRYAHEELQDMLARRGVDP